VVVVPYGLEERLIFGLQPGSDRSIQATVFLYLLAFILPQFTLYLALHPVDFLLKDSLQLLNAHLISFFYLPARSLMRLDIVFENDLLAHGTVLETHGDFSILGSVSSGRLRKLNVLHDVGLGAELFKIKRSSGHWLRIVR
jgi:hypothetical protein